MLGSKKREKQMEKRSDIYEVKGRIFDIQKYSIHDGPGIRTIIFLKGCILRCKWCCNPESQEYEVQSMMENGKEKIIGRDVTVEEVMREIRKDSMYYRKSGGGVTLSGGEVLCQPEFAKAILQACQEEGFSTAIETAASVEFSIIQTLLPHIDYVLMDIKHVDGRKHKEFTGKDNQMILENARKIAESCANVTVRVPVIPSFNDTKAEISNIAEFASRLRGVQELHLLPYHRFGSGKYEALGRGYAMEGIPMLEDNYMEELLQTAMESGLRCQIGG